MVVCGQRSRALLTGLLLSLGLFGCGVKPEPVLTVYAAASLRDAMQAIGEAYEETHGVTVRFNFAGSNVLAQQLQAAPRADLYVSADRHWMDALVSAGRVESGAPRPLVGNQLAVVARAGAQPVWEKPTDGCQVQARLLILADPVAVPAGRYAWAWLNHLPCMEGTSLAARWEERLAPTPDVRSAVGQIAAAPDLWGVVYRSDYQRMASKLDLLYLVPLAEGPEIRYWVAPLVAAEHPEEAARFLAFLARPEIDPFFAAEGFVPLREGDAPERP